MQISEVEIHEFEIDNENVNSLHEYQPGTRFKSPGFILSITCSDGTTGYYRGFIYADTMVSQIKKVTPRHLLNRDPLARVGIWEDLWTVLASTGHIGLGPIDIALWDIAGKVYGASVSELLGGSREKIPAYASTYLADSASDGLNSPESYADFAEACYEAGYSGFKIHAFGDPDKDIEVCRAVDQAIGDKMDLMLDPANHYKTYTGALKVGRVLDELEFLWYEDPLSDNGESMPMAKRLSTCLPLVCQESD